MHRVSFPAVGCQKGGHGTIEIQKASSVVGKAETTVCKARFVGNRLAVQSSSVQGL